jgi:hypothetical protein
MDAIFVVAFEGTSVECDSMDDATTLKFAAEILGRGEFGEVGHPKLRQLTDLLSRYGQGDAADRMRRLTAKARALDLLSSTRGYVRPKRRSTEL